MWFFLEFLPEILSLVKKVKENLNSTKVRLVLIIYFLSIVLISLYFSFFMDYVLYAIFTLILGITLTIILNKALTKNAYSTFYEFEEATVIKTVKYKQLLDNRILIPQFSYNIEAVFCKNTLFIQINEDKIYSDSLTIQDFFRSYIFRRKIYNPHTDSKHLIIIKLTGYIRPKIEIKIRKVNE
jgi:hypothetical protein